MKYLGQINDNKDLVNKEYVDTATYTVRSEIPTELPANGGNSDTVDNLHAIDFASAVHNHDDRYYQRLHLDDLFGGKADKTSDGIVTSPNADYAEIMEWSDQNISAENRIGYFVSIDTTVAGNTIVKATSTSDVFGIVMNTPGFAAGADEYKYNNGVLLDKYCYVGFAGFVSVIDNGSCVINDRCMPDDNGCAVPSTNNLGYHVIDRIDATHVIILVEPNIDMIQRIKVDMSAKAPITSPTFTGTVTLAADPVSNLQAATKQYVDNTLQNISITTDPIPTCDSGNAVQSGGVYTALAEKQTKLIGTAGQVVGFDINGNAIAQDNNGGGGNIVRATESIAANNTSIINIPVVITDTNTLTVYHNGIMLTPTVHYTATTSAITLIGYTANAGDIFTFIVSAVEGTSLNAAASQILFSDTTADGKYETCSTVQDALMHIAQWKPPITSITLNDVEITPINYNIALSGIATESYVNTAINNAITTALAGDY